MGIYWQLNSLHLQIILSHSICISTCRCRFWEFFVLFLQGTSPPGCHLFCYQTTQNLWTEFHYQPKRVSCPKQPCRSYFGPQLDCLDVRAVQEHHEKWSFENIPIRWLFLIWLTFLSDLIYLYTIKQTCMRHVFYRPILTTGRFSVSSFRICRELWVRVYRSVVIKSLNQVNKPWLNKGAWYLLAFSRFRQAETSICEKKCNNEINKFVIVCQFRGLFTWRWGTPGRWDNPPSRGRKIKRGLHTILQPRGAGVRFLEVVVALVIKEFEQRRPKLTSRERRKINSRTHV